MRSHNLILFVVLTLGWVITAFGQPPAAKIAVINTPSFGDEKSGITRLVTAYKSLAVEFKTVQDELTALGKQHEQLANEIKDLNAKVNAGGPVDVNAIRASINAKSDEGANLELRIRRKQEDAKSRYGKREEQIVGPINKEIMLAIEAYSEKNKIDLLIDVSKNEGVLLFANTALDITDAFIKDFNAKTSGVPVK